LVAWWIGGEGMYPTAAVSVEFISGLHRLGTGAGMVGMPEGAGMGRRSQTGPGAVFGAAVVRDETGGTGPGGRFAKLRSGGDERHTIRTTIGTRPRGESSNEAGSWIVELCFGEIYPPAGFSASDQHHHQLCRADAGASVHGHGMRPQTAVGERGRAIRSVEMEQQRNESLIYPTSLTPVQYVEQNHHKLSMRSLTRRERRRKRKEHSS